jgi:hypothetical protein
MGMLTDWLVLMLFQKHFPYLKALKNLKHLTIPKLMYLGLGYNAPRCSCAYHNNPGLKEEVARNQKNVEGRLVELIEEFLAASSLPSSQIDTIAIPGKYTISIASNVASDGITLPMLEDVSVGPPSNATSYKIVHIGTDRKLQNVVESG